MSCDYYMACHDCCTLLHVAQDGLSGWTFYTGEPECMKALGVFFDEHRSHRIGMVPEQTHEDYDEIDWTPAHVTAAR